MTREELDALLAALDPDRDRAAEKYEVTRRKLIRLFEWRGCECPEDLTDQTIERVARRFNEGVKVQSNIFSYFYGVAHLIHKEFLRRAAREKKVLERGDWPSGQTDGEPEDDRRIACLRRCLSELPPDQKTLLLRYYQGESNIRNRKDLCRELGIPINALRIRVHRARRRLESCIHDCLAR